MKTMIHSTFGSLHRIAFSVRFWLRSLKWRRAGKRPRPANPVFLISGFFNETLGIGRAGHLVAHALEKSGYKVIRDDLRPYDRGLLTRNARLFPEAADAQVWLMEANAPETKIALFGRDFESWEHLYRIAVWHWESSVAPLEWLDMVKWFDEIWVTTDFVKHAFSEALRDAGMADQIFKLKLKPLPVPVPPDQKQTAPSEIVKVITLFDPRSHFERKNPDAILKAWLLAFPKPSNATLLIKALDNASNYPAFHSLVAQAAGRPDITFQCETLNDEATGLLIANHDILISLHRGEGFGLTMAEAMAAGLAVIATGWSGNMQFMNAENSILVPFKLVPAVPRYNGPRAVWAEPDINAAAGALLKLVNNKSLRDTLGTKARYDITLLGDEWSYENAFPTTSR